MRSFPLTAALSLVVLVGCNRPREYRFRCPDGAILGVSYVTDTARLTLARGTARLPRVISGSGARYANDTLEFWEHAGEVRVSLRGRVEHSACHR
jgi:membrane-bound inhibitor of C-type lysozyme